MRGNGHGVAPQEGRRSIRRVLMCPANVESLIGAWNWNEAPLPAAGAAAVPLFGCWPSDGSLTR